MEECRIIAIMQKHDADGVVWVRREAGGKDEFSHCAWMYETKQLYTPDGQRIDLWMSQFEVSGIVTKEDVPRHKVGEDSTCSAYFRILHS